HERLPGGSRDGENRVFTLGHPRFNCRSLRWVQFTDPLLPEVVEKCPIERYGVDFHIVTPAR
ncbi:MAG: hypothetical protein ACI9EZ_001731, partial [Halobacteriales archaeon]